ncbi:MAG: putative cytoplasmic protein [Gammaproteobacteria bacterium]|nr:putative cytoplasmic protein [Gammaproteobacteria bacterium]
MLNDTKIDSLIKQILDNLPAELTLIKQDLEKNFRSAVTIGLANMDLVTREEFDIQSELLARTRVLLEEMEKKVTELEAALTELD